MAGRCLPGTARRRRRLARRNPRTRRTSPPGRAYRVGRRLLRTEAQRRRHPVRPSPRRRSCRTARLPRPTRRHRHDRCCPTARPFRPTRSRRSHHSLRTARSRHFLSRQHPRSPDPRRRQRGPNPIRRRTLQLPRPVSRCPANADCACWMHSTSRAAPRQRTPVMTLASAKSFRPEATPGHAARCPGAQRAAVRNGVRPAAPRPCSVQDAHASPASSPCRSWLQVLT